jgi:hypothetical protein
MKSIASFCFTHFWFDISCVYLDSAELGSLFGENYEYILLTSSHDGERGPDW